MSKLAVYRADHGDVAGWFEEESQLIWDCLLTYQADSNISGNMLEIGVFAGKSAALSTLHASEGERCEFVDPLQFQPVIDRLKAIGPAECAFFQCHSSHLDAPGFYAERAQKYRWIHIDGEHTGMAVQNDMTVADKLLQQTGLLILDDFFNPSYPQITRAAFRYLDAHPGSFSLVLCGYNKGYFSRPISAPTVRSYIYHQLVDEMEARGTGQFRLWRTTVPDDMSAFGITRREPGGAKYKGPDWAQTQVFV